MDGHTAQALKDAPDQNKATQVTTLADTGRSRPCQRDVVRSIISKHEKVGFDSQQLFASLQKKAA